jgi:putative transposase
MFLPLPFGAAIPGYRRDNAMPRMARVVLPGVPHHITQRGVRRLKVFRDDEDYRLYLRLLLRFARHYRLGIAAYCLMPNHIHLVGIPEHGDSLGNALQVCHSQYVQRFNEKYEKRGHLWEERPWSCPMDESYSWAAVSNGIPWRRKWSIEQKTTRGVARPRVAA